MGPGLLGYTVRRVLWAIPVLFVISIMVFAMLRLAPGDPVDRILGQAHYDPVVADRLRAKYGYDQPIYVQYAKYMENLAHGDLGVSPLHSDFTASDVILPNMLISTLISFMAIIITFVLGTPIVVYAALARGTFPNPLTIACSLPPAWNP